MHSRLRVPFFGASAARLGVAFLLIWMVLPTPSATAQAPNPDQIWVKSITYGGTGCPQGSVATSLSNDRTSFTVIFDSFVASTGTGIPITESLKSCQLNVNLNVPSGWAFSVAKFVSRGYVQLGASSSATTQTTLYFGDYVQSASVEFGGPIAKDYLSATETPPFNLSQSECGGEVPIQIHALVSITGPASNSSQITTDSIDGKFSGDTGLAQGFELVWFPCTPIVIDDEDPVISAIPSVAPNSNGWNNTDVEVYFDCIDTGSGVDADASDLGPFVLTESGTVTGVCVDLAGNVATATYAALIDKEAPTISIVSPISGGLYGLGASVPAEFSCDDSGSGVASCDGASTLATDMVGSGVYGVTASDLAGNTASAEVTYSTGGKEECRKGGWALFLNPTFSNQGRCISSFVP